MIWLIVYDRSTAETVYMREYADQQREAAAADRLAEELASAHSKLDREVVILEAANLETLRRTHGRYFEDVERIAKRRIWPNS